MSNIIQFKFQQFDSLKAFAIGTEISSNEEDSILKFEADNKILLIPSIIKPEKLNIHLTTCRIIIKKWKEKPRVQDYADSRKMKEHLYELSYNFPTRNDEIGTMLSSINQIEFYEGKLTPTIYQYVNQYVNQSKI